MTDSPKAVKIKTKEVAEVLKVLVNFGCTYAKIGEYEFELSGQMPPKKPRARRGSSQSPAQIGENVRDAEKERAVQNLEDELDTLSLIDPLAYEKLVLEGDFDESVGRKARREL